MDNVQRRKWVARAVREVRRDACFWYRPHARQSEFHTAGSWARERLFLAGNRVGKTLAGAAEVAFHLTGRYPNWWKGVRFEGPVRAWAASVTREVTRDILQEVYLGRDGVIPPRLILGTMMKGSVSGAVDTVRIRHSSGGVSVLGFKSFDQGRASFQGTAREVVHLDEEPEIEIYEECLLRTLTVKGQVMLTMTPLSGLTEMVRHFSETGRQEGKCVVQAGWAEAPHLDADDVARFRKSLRSFEVAAREFGVPSVGRGRVFPIEESEVACARFEIPAHWKKCVGVDFGWANPTAAVWLVHDAESDTVYVTRQIPLTADQQAQKDQLDSIMQDSLDEIQKLSSSDYTNDPQTQKVLDDWSSAQDKLLQQQNQTRTQSEEEALANRGISDSSAATEVRRQRQLDGQSAEQNLSNQKDEMSNEIRNQQLGLEQNLYNLASTQTNASAAQAQQAAIKGQSDIAALNTQRQASILDYYNSQLQGSGGGLFGNSLQTGLGGTLGKTIGSGTGSLVSGMIGSLFG